jgi:hypothetical protein
MRYKVPLLNKGICPGTLSSHIGTPLVAFSPGVSPFGYPWVSDYPEAFGRPC